MVSYITGKFNLESATKGSYSVYVNGVNVIPSGFYATDLKITSVIPSLNNSYQNASVYSPEVTGLFRPATTPPYYPPVVYLTKTGYNSISEHAIPVAYENHLDAVSFLIPSDSAAGEWLFTVEQDSATATYPIELRVNYTPLISYATFTPGLNPGTTSTFEIHGQWFVKNMVVLITNWYETLGVYATNVVTTNIGTLITGTVTVPDTFNTSLAAKLVVYADASYTLRSVAKVINWG